MLCCVGLRCVTLRCVEKCEKTHICLFAEMHSNDFFDWLNDILTFDASDNSVLKLGELSRNREMTSK